MNLAISQPVIGEQAVQRHLLEIYAGLPAGDLATMPLDLSLRMGGQLARRNQELFYQWFFVAMKQRTVHERVSGLRLRELFRLFRIERLADPTTEDFYTALFTRMQPRLDKFGSSGKDDLRQDLKHAVEDIDRFDRELFSETMIQRLHCLTKIFTLTDYLLLHGTLENVRGADQMLAFGQLDIDLGPLFDDIAWLAQRMLPARTFTKLNPNQLGTLRGWSVRKRRFALDLTWQG